MNLFGWFWFGPLVAAILFASVPLIGQLGFLILAVIGAYYVWDANFDWHKAAYPPTKTFSISISMSTENDVAVFTLFDGLPTFASRLL